MASRGRPARSQIRQNIIEILNVAGPLYGYKLHKFYNEIFPSCTRENIYYNLRKGVALNELSIADVREEKGEYSWGSVVEKKYYKLGPRAVPRGDERVREFFEELEKLSCKRE
ncbi:hypothetical protein D6825_02645 [Candidatus Woesearchaeota archaeon]|nr:MAG: hypothetical protein D6825_02645 [Candidatus Woesearchaeota archaeon]